MGLCENVRCWRWQGSTGAFRTGVKVILLWLSLAQSVSSQGVCPAAAAPLNLTQPQYQGTAVKDTGVGFMAAPVHSFLNTVQPNPFPKELILKIYQDIGQVLSNQELIKKVLLYEVGFLVCVAIGILYIILMPIVGFFLACCRCCGNCGGKMYQKQTSAIPCRRRTLYWSTFITTVIILAGNICMFRSNEALKVSVDQSPVKLSSTIDNINTFITAVPQQVQYVVNESNRTVQQVTRNLQDIGSQLGTRIQKRFNRTLDPALLSVKRLNQETINITVQLNKLNSSLDQLQSNMNRLQANITTVKNHINQTLSDPNCQHCNNFTQRLVTLDTSITVPNMKELQSAVDDVVKTNLQSKIREVEDYFQSMPQMVTNETKDVVESSRKLLGEIQTQISTVTNDIPLNNVANISGNLNQAQKEIDKVTPYIETAERIRWSICVAICCVVLLVVACNFLGLFLGPVGLTPSADPTKRSCIADCGGTFFLMGAGFSFLFSWLFMIVVLVLFLLGGNVYTLVCQPWNNGELLKFIDTPGLIPGLDIGSALGIKGNISISDIYSDCKQNKTLWTTLHLNELVDLDDFLNVSKYTEQIKNEFEKTDISLSSFTLLSADIKNKLTSFSSKTSNFDFTAVTQQMNNISSINLNTTAEEIDIFADSQPNSGIKKDLQSQANNLRQIQADIEMTINPQLKSLNSTIKSLQSTTENINGTVGEVLSNVGAAQDFLNKNTTQIVKTESRTFVDCQLNYFIAFADWANLTITQQVGRCGPVAGAFDSFEVILCAYMVESLNAFWFSLGWCMIFFIPSIIFSIKLAKYYRKMKYSDVLENHIMMNHIPRAHMKPF